jgi:mannose-1-phosphate guanylyltransferase
MINPNNYCIIMAGGIGSRFWPMSRTAYPKQFHDILGTGQTLIQMTFSRLTKVCPPENIYIVTNEMYKDQVMEQLEGIDESQVLLEPSRRNTAPCIAYATYKIAGQNPDAAMVVAPSDHLILKEDDFVNTINLALQQAREHKALVTLGIKPSRPDTGYGYIQFIDEAGTAGDSVKRVKMFAEKPKLPLAKTFLESGDFYWNSGIFIWTAEAILASFKKHLPDMNTLFKDGESAYNTPQEQDFINKVYSMCQNESIDYGIMEKANNVYVVLSDFGWSDLGTWGSLYTHLDHDKEENGVVGNNVMLYNSSNNIVNVPEDKLVILQGLDDYIVVESNNVLLVCKKGDEQQIKQFVNDIRLQKGEEFV